MLSIFRLADNDSHLTKRCPAILLLAGLILSLPGCSRSGGPENPSLPEITLTANDRILILAPHPDDDIIGCAGVIQEALAARLPLHVVFLTYGDGNQWAFTLYRKRPVVTPGAVKSMGMLRRDEALAALASLGVREDNVTFLGYPDFNTLDIWESHWGDRPPRESLFTRSKAVPYPNAFRAGAPYKGEEILRDLETLLGRFRPTKLFVSHPADRHPDHEALYLFARVALWDLDELPKPVVYPFLVHCGRWPAPPGYHPDERLAPPKSLEENGGRSWQSFRLTPEEVARKHAALMKHRSQWNAGSAYLLSFVRANELFGDLPTVALGRDSTSRTQSLERPGEVPEVPEGLVDEERVAFVGVVERSISLEDGKLTVSVTLSRPLGEAVGVSVYVFGYRHDRAFADMPKLHVRFGAVNHEVYDQDRRLPRTTVELMRSFNQVRVRVPLGALANPERVLTSVRTYISAVPLDSSSWRVLELTDRH